MNRNPEMNGNPKIMVGCVEWKGRAMSRAFRAQVMALTALVAVAGAGCLTSDRANLFFSDVVPPPDSTTDNEVTISGIVVRSPPRQGLTIVVQVTGGADTARTLAGALGVFLIEVPLQRDTVNRLLMTADDGTGSISQELPFTVVQVPPVAQSPSVTPGR